MFLRFNENISKSLIYIIERFKTIILQVHVRIEKSASLQGNHLVSRTWGLSNNLPLTRSSLTLPLKVVGYEKLGGSRGWLLLEGDTGLWRSMSVCVLI
jgi:hypothetical protein